MVPIFCATLATVDIYHTVTLTSHNPKGVTGVLLLLLIIIIKRISRAPIYHTKWQHRALYNNTNHTHARTRTHTHTHTASNEQAEQGKHNIFNTTKNREKKAQRPI